jgi:hypothetical protein
MERGKVKLAKTGAKLVRGGKRAEAVSGRGEVKSPPPASRGRPSGKRSDPEFTPVYAYIRGATHKEVKIKLIRQGDRDFSELLEELLAAWLKSDD